MEMLDKIIAILVVLLAFKICYSIISKFFLKGMKIGKLVKLILDKYNMRGRS